MELMNPGFPSPSFGGFGFIVATAKYSRRSPDCLRGNTNMANCPDSLRSALLKKKEEVTARLERITANLRRGYEADSKERAIQLEDSEVVDALGNEARLDL